MVKIRFRRVGLKRQPSYRIVVMDSRKSRDGGFIEIIGNHNPRTRPEVNVIKEDRALYWLSVGAQPTDAVRRVLERLGTLARYERMTKGESLEALVAESQAAQSTAPVSYKTSFPSPAAGESWIKAREAAKGGSGE
ncbi:MAG: 30S ribosomal protein S16 [Phototrophicaceae bacterium]|jgi:small subunit ribosomal protein S16